MACGPRKGPEANATYFWKIDTSSLEWGACGDSQALRGGVGAIAVSASSYLTYKVDPAGQKAVSQTCLQLNPSSCTPSPANIVFDIAGNELTFTSSAKKTIDQSTCALQQSDTWTIVDQISTMSLEIATVLSLVDNPTSCPGVEAGIKRDSPNGLGVTGCVLTRRLTGTLR